MRAQRRGPTSRFQRRRPLPSNGLASSNCCAARMPPMSRTVSGHPTPSSRRMQHPPADETTTS